MPDKGRAERHQHSQGAEQLAVSFLTYDEFKEEPLPFVPALFPEDAWLA